MKLVALTLLFGLGCSMLAQSPNNKKTPRKPAREP